MADQIKDEILFNMIVRIISIENLLIDKGIVTNDEIQSEIAKVSAIVIKSISQKIIESSLQEDDIDGLIKILTPKKDIKIN